MTRIVSLDRLRTHYLQAALAMMAMLPMKAAAFPFYDKLGTNDPKWAAYGGPNDTIDTEVQGTVLWIWGGYIYLSPDPAYTHLLLTGNKIKPPADEYDHTRYPDLDTKWQPGAARSP